MTDRLIDEIPHNWPFGGARTDRDVDDMAVLHRALTWAVRHGWTRIDTARWTRPHVLSSHRWTPGGRVIVDWGNGQLGICYLAPLTRPDRTRRFSYYWTDAITVESVRQGMAVLAAIGLVPTHVVDDAAST